MAIDAKHPLYEANIAKWTKCHDAYEGEEKIKAADTTYLPRVDPDQSSSEYNAYKARALYFEAVGRTVDGFTGAISRKPHIIELPAKLEPLVDDATNDGLALNELIKRLCAETLLTSRIGLLVDYDEAKQRSYFVPYLAEDIYNWDDDSVVLHEIVYEADPDEAFGRIAVEQIRQLYFEDGRYTVTLWRQRGNSQVVMQEWAPVSTIVPTTRGRPIAEMPFFWLSHMGMTARIEKPPLLGLVNVALSHYRTSADLEHGRHFTALPTLYITGMKVDEPIRVGAGAVILLSDPQSKAGYAEFSGAGLGSLERALETKEMQMAQLGAAIFGSGRKGIEAAETARIRTSGEQSLLMGVVSAVQETITAALECAAEWMAAPAAGVQVELNRDFVDVSLDAKTLQGLVMAYQAGAMTLEAFLYCLAQGEFLPPETVIADEAAKLKQAQAAQDAQDAKQALAVAKAKPPVPVAPANPGGK